MRVAVYTLTRDRLDFTKHCFSLFREKAGYPFDHYVLDNGSQDGTREWLAANRSWFADVLYEPTNLGIGRASNKVLDLLSSWRNYDMVVKFDNDCEVHTGDILAHLVRCFEDTRRFAERMALSPRVEGIVNQPARIREVGRGGLRIGVTGIIGGLFQAIPWEVHQHYRYPLDLPLAYGYDGHICEWLKRNGALIGYVEELQVNHYMGTHEQAKIYPEYFARKRAEEKTKFGETETTT